MKYKKGTFVVVPNTEYLNGKPQAQQLLFFWLCYHANEDGQCFPSRAKLAREISCTTKTVDNYIKVLELDGVIEKTTRKISGKKENMSNLYQILQVENVETLRGETTDPTPSEPSDPVTIPNLNYTHLTTITDEIKEECQWENCSGGKYCEHHSLLVKPITLPVQRGKQPSQRLLTIYKDLFKFFYGYEYKPNFGRDLKILSSLLDSYSELQIARLLTIFFNWHGMTGGDDMEFNKLSGAVFPLAWFKSCITQYETYSRNIIKDNFEDDKELLIEVGKHISSIKS